MPTTRRILLTLGIPVALASGCDPEGTPIATDTGEASRPPAEVPPAARSILASTGRVQLIAEVAPDIPRMQVRSDRLSKNVRARGILDEVNHLRGILPTDAVVTRTYQQMPLAVVDVTSAAGLDALDGLDGVVAWHLDERHSRTLDASLPLIHQPEAEAGGFTGEGTAVAVLDTGLDYTHADFGSCSAPGASGCQVVAMQEVAPDDGELDDHGHGTNVAAIVGGVAPGTDLIGMDVFRSDGYAYTSDIVGAIDWVVDHQDTYNIVALNMSLGGGQYTDECAWSAYEVAIAIADDAGVASAVASGNDGWTDSIASPACAPTAVKVGAVYAQSYGRIGWSTCTDAAPTADQVTCFSNSASFMDLLAPGAIIDAGGYRMGGTSQATPHVAGALAVVAEAFPGETPSQWTDRLVDTGTTVTDDRNGLVVPRIDVEAAVMDAIVGEPPTVYLSLDQDAPYTNYRGVDADLVVTDGTASATEMCLANADNGVPSTCTDWTTLDENGRWWLSSGQGDKTVAVWVRDDAGRTSDPATAGITLDTIPPEDVRATASWSSDSVSLSWDAATDSSSGVSSYVVVHTAGSSAPTDCTSGTEVYAGTATSTSITGLPTQSDHSFRVCAYDAAANLSEGTTAAVSATSSVAGSVAVNGGATYINARDVQLTIAADGAAQMCISNRPNCTPDGWEPYATERDWTLANEEGDQRVSVWFRAADGTVSPPATTDIFVDWTRPETGSVSATGTMQEGATRVSWSGFTDAGSGVAAYRVVPVRGRFAATTCMGTGTLVDGDTTATTVDFAMRGPDPRVAVCGVDAAGNMSRAVVASVR